MKFKIVDAVSNDSVKDINFTPVIINAISGKHALVSFTRHYVMSTGMYEYHKTKFGNWVMTSSYGTYFVAVPVK